MGASECTDRTEKGSDWSQGYSDSSLPCLHGSNVSIRLVYKVSLISESLCRSVAGSHHLLIHTTRYCTCSVTLY